MLIKLQQHSHLFKEGSWILIGQIVTIAGSLVLVRVLTEYLTPADYGVLALGLTVAGLMHQVIMGGISQGIIRYYSIAVEKKSVHKYLHASSLLLIYATFSVLFLGVLIIGSLYLFGFSEWIGLVIAMLIFSIITGYNSALNGIQNAARQRAIVAFHGGLNAWLKIIFAIILMLLFGNTIIAVVYGYVLAILLVFISQFFF